MTQEETKTLQIQQVEQSDLFGEAHHKPWVMYTFEIPDGRCGLSSQKDA